jgi:hypothetical protein
MFGDVQDTANQNAQVRCRLSELLNAVRAWWNEAKRRDAQLSAHR